MSLLLDARKKSQQARSGQGEHVNHAAPELTLQPMQNPTGPSGTSSQSARSIGQNLFQAKSRHSANVIAGINRNLFFALIGTILFLAAGSGYVWYTISAQPNSASIRSFQNPVHVANPPQNNLVPGIEPAKVVAVKPQAKSRHSLPTQARASRREPEKSNQILVQRHQDEPVYPILKNAYIAYGNGKFDQAKQLYQKALSLDGNNLDAILGLAAIAQRRGEDTTAKQYFSQALTLDPRNAVANAGMSVLSSDGNHESHLKMLLDQQPDSPALNFALGNLYAGESRWGEAQQAYFNAYRLDPNNAELALNLAISLDRLGQKNVATQYYQRALLLDPDQNAGFDHKQIAQRIENLSH